MGYTARILGQPELHNETLYFKERRTGMETGEGWGDSSVTAVPVYKFESLNLILQKLDKKPGAVAHSCHLCTAEAEEEGSLVLAA